MTALQKAIDKLKAEHLENAADSSTYKPYQRAINICTSFLEIEKEQITQAYGDGMNPHRNDNCNREEYFIKNFTIS